MSIPADVASAELRFTLLEGAAEVGKAAIVTWWIPTLATTWDAALVLLAQNVADGWSTNVDPTSYSAAVRLDDVVAIKPNPDGSAQYKQITPPATPWRGTNASNSLPWEASLVISLYTYTPGTFVPNGRQRRGRSYLPPFAVGVMAGSETAGFITTSIRDASLADHASFLQYAAFNLGVLTNIPVVVSRVSSSSHVITDLAADVRMDSQRRRERKQVPPKVSVPVVL